jgi:hypothetical protein
MKKILTFSFCILIVQYTKGNEDDANTKIIPGCYSIIGVSALSMLWSLTKTSCNILVYYNIVSPTTSACLGTYCCCACCICTSAVVCRGLNQETELVLSPPQLNWLRN